MVEFLCVRRWGKGNKTKFYWGVLKVYVGSIQYGVLKHLGTESCVWSLIFLVKMIQNI